MAQHLCRSMGEDWRLKLSDFLKSSTWNKFILEGFWRNTQIYEEKTAVRYPLFCRTKWICKYKLQQEYVCLVFDTRQGYDKSFPASQGNPSESLFTNPWGWRRLGPSKPIPTIGHQICMAGNGDLWDGMYYDGFCLLPTMQDVLNC